MANLGDHAREARRALSDPRRLCEALGLTKGAQRNQDGYLISCPAHGDRTPSCSVKSGPDKTVQVICFACGFTGDALTLIAVARGLDLKADFKEVLLAACDIGGLHSLADEIESGQQEPRTPIAATRRPVETPLTVAESDDRTYPPQDAVMAVWESAMAVTEDTDASGCLVQRRLDPDYVARLNLARVVPRGARLPDWARYQGVSWSESGHRMLVPMVDSAGEFRSLRAWRISGDHKIKRLPPAGHKATGLVMVNGKARDMLRSGGAPRRVLVVEGEPDFLVASTQWSYLPVIGVVSGSWTPELANRVPLGSEVVILTHHDRAGEKYAQQVIGTVKNRAVVIRSAA